MLCYGNFIFAYPTPFRAPSVAALEAELGEWARRPEDSAAAFAERSPKLVDIELIPRGDPTGERTLSCRYSGAWNANSSTPESTSEGAVADEALPMETGNLVVGLGPTLPAQSHGS
jgi:hypothetical protein